MKNFKNNATTMKEMDEATRPQRVKMRDALRQRVNMERDEINSQEEGEDVAPVAEPSLAPTFFEPLEPTSDVPAHNTRSRTMRSTTQEVRVRVNPNNIKGHKVENMQWFIDKMNKRTGKNFQKPAGF